MAKTATLNLRVDPDNKRQAEAILEQLGISMSAAMDMYLKQIVLTGGIPFPVKLPAAPASANADTMTNAELVGKLERGVAAARNGEAVDAAQAFRAFKAVR